MAQFLEFPLEIPALAVPISYSARRAGEQRFSPSKAVWMQKAAEGRLLSLLRAEPDVQNQRDALISQRFMRNGLVRGGWRVGGIKYVNISLDGS